MTTDLAGLSAEEKRVLLARLLMEKAEAAASAHPLSYGQRSLWFLYQLAPGSPAYTITYAGQIRGDLDVSALQAAAQALVDRHDILRTTYTTRAGQPVQLVHPRWPVRVTHLELDREETPRWLRREADRPFDLRTGPVLRFHLISHGAGEHLLVLTLHHIAVDMWSIDLILDELRLLYAAEHGGSPPPPLPPMRYVDYALEQTRAIEGAEGDRLWRYWSRQLAGETPLLRLPVDRPRGAVQTYRGAVQRFTVDRTLTAQLKELGRRGGATPYMTLFAAYATLLHRYSGQDDLLIGSPFGCRDHAGLASLVGYLANPVVLRPDLSGDPTFTSLLGRVKTTVLQALEHQDFPFALLVEKLDPARDVSHTPLFQVSFAWEQTRRFQDGAGAASVPGVLDLTTTHIGQGGAPLDLMLLMGEQDGELLCALQYNTDLFDDATIERMAEHFTTLLRGIVADPDLSLSQLPIRTEAERSQQTAWNDTEVRFEGPDTLPEMVTAAARRSPAAIAVRFDDRDLTYAELDRRADDVAARLLSRGVRPDSIVVVLLDRSEDLVVALLGVAKSGAAFMPLDPGQPANRIAAMIETSGASVVVTHQRNLQSIKGFGGDRLCLDLPPAASETGAVTSSPVPRPDGLAYVVHTSGSTGVPKRVLNTHGGLRNLLLWMQANYRLDAGDRVLHHTPVTFDASLAEIFVPLIVGARLVIAKPDGHRDAAYLVQTIAEQGITQIVHVVPSMLQSWLGEPGLNDCVTLRRVTCGGEALPYDLAQRFLNTVDVELWNEYGPAECAVTATYAHCQRGAPGPSIPIGRPIANVAIHLLDAYLQPVPVGVPGELYIGGAGVGRGYAGQPDLTATRFVADPFSGEPGAMLYRTGDLARYRSDGNIFYLGRRDSQVEIRGVRIEPGEVEVVLSRHPDVNEAVVVAGTDERGHTRLTAHVAASTEPGPTTAQLRRFLLEWLPAAMVPAHFVVKSELPRTSGGKVDRRALAADGSTAAQRDREYVAPRNRTEQVLAEIWRTVLGVDRVGVHDDFFALGGSSTHSLEVAVRAETAGLPLKPESVFLFGTIAELAAEYGDQAPSDAPAVRPDASPQPLSAPSEFQPTPSTKPTRNTVIESIGTYLPFTVVSTADLLAGCVNDIGIPLERLTGIKHRRVVADGEFAIDLARQAAADCLSRSSYRPAEIDLLISCSISRCDGPDQKFVFEPSTAARLRDQCGLDNAVAFDITNACAGMFTGIAIADAFLQTGLIGRAMVVSGEYITHISATAQREIEGPMDPRLACLTVGDAGAAVILERGRGDRAGFHDIDIATLSRYAPMCIGKATAGPEGGAIMTVDSIAATAIAVQAAVPYVAGVMRRHGWRPEHCDHIVMHQTSESSINDAVGAVNRMFGEGSANPGNTIYNLSERGNTASTTHFVAVKDHILSNRIRSGDNAVFGISGSGQTVGAALYTFDDLPDRLRRGSDSHRGLQAPRDAATMEPPPPPAVGIAGVGTIPAGPPGSRGSVELAAQAAEQCLDRTGLDRDQLGLIIHAGVYRDEFISEPAIAALVAGELGINDDVRSPDGPKTLAFDVFNGAVGFLNACQVAVQMIGAGRTGHAMVVASEIENNSGSGGHPAYGLSETGSAVILSPTDGSQGFGRFVFRHYPEYADALVTYTSHSDDRTWLEIDRDPELAAHYLDIIADAVGELLKLEAIASADIAAVFPPHLSPADRDELATRLGIASSLFVAPAGDADPFSSSVPHGLQHAWQHGLVRSDDVGLIVSVGSGLQVGCTTYRF
ncbi:amino acid adenylation domain-containing protein [Mycobacterium sp.]|uniref:amino acid adenylation domain-containing protein n=1 Tax=Mycobacterium sp. TaxID=1785 RepID=UPI0031DACCB4